MGGRRRRGRTFRDKRTKRERERERLSFRECGLYLCLSILLFSLFLRPNSDLFKRENSGLYRRALRFFPLYSGRLFLRNVNLVWQKSTCGKKDLTYQIISLPSSSPLLLRGKGGSLGSGGGRGRCRVHQEFPPRLPVRP